MRSRSIVFILLGIVVLIFVLGALYRIPKLRASAYPVLAFLDRTSLSVLPYCPVYTTDEYPTFVFSTDTAHYYDFYLYRKDQMVAGTTISAKEMNGDKRLFSALCPYLDVTSELLLKRPDIVPVYRCSGIFSPLDFDSAEGKVVLPNKLAVGDYIGLLRAGRVPVGQVEAKQLPFRVTNLGAIVKTDRDGLSVLAFDLRNCAMLRNVKLSVYERSSFLQDDMKLFGRTMTGANGFASLALREDKAEELVAPESLVLDLSKGENRAFLGGFNSEDQGDYTLPPGSFNYAGFEYFSPFRKLANGKDVYGNAMGELASVSAIEDGIVDEISDKRLSVKLDKESYLPSDIVEVSIDLPPCKRTPVLLASLEGTVLLAKELVKVDAGSDHARTSFKLPDDMGKVGSILVAYVGDKHLPLLVGQKFAVQGFSVDVPEMEIEHSERKQPKLSAGYVETRFTFAQYMQSRLQTRPWIDKRGFDFGAYFQGHNQGIR